MSNTKCLVDLVRVCSVLPALLIMPALADVPQPVDGKILGQTVSNETAGVYNVGTLGLDLLIADSNFVNNSNTGWGGVVHVTGGHDLTINNSRFLDNYSAVGGGAVSSGTKADMLKIDGATFTNNHAREDGGAVASYRGLDISNTIFTGNTAQYEKDDEGAWTKVVAGTDPVGGGALSLGAVSETSIATVASTVFSENASGVNGGAIGTRLARGVTADGKWTTTKNSNTGKLDLAATFEDNFAARSGGAIYNTFYADNGLGKGDGVTVTGIFEDNEAGYRGGAIYNDGDLDYNNKGAVMTVNNATFTDNEAGDMGGAIYNTGTLTVNGGVFADNEAGQWAGAIYNSGATDTKDLHMQKAASIQTAGDLTIKNATFLNNSATWGGAVVAGTSAKNTVIENTRFEGNTADEIGALGMFSAGTLKNVVFYDNHATSADALSDGAGALFLGAVSSTDVDGVLSDSVFDSNTSAARGGAIATRSFKSGDNTAATLDIKNTMFKNNVAATNGGAFDNFFYHSATNSDAVYVKGSSFVNNSAINGGAIYNHGTDSEQNPYASVPTQAASIELNNVQFVDNHALGAGGAIYNEAGATVVLSGNNLFSGNVAKGLSNDIHNMGTLNITGGKTTFGGGVDGTTGTFNLAQGATLDLGTATIRQGTIDLQGTVIASLLNDSVRGRTYGRFIGDVTVGENAAFQLNVGAVGTYDVWDGLIVDADKVSVGDIYEIAGIDANGIKIVTKSVDAIAQDTGISTQAAGAVAGLANTTSNKAHRVSLALQEALNAGDAAYVEAETAKLNPTDKPVAQAATTSVQNQVLSLASGRMSGGVSVGRSGGDEYAQENGFWIQGLFNKSKFADQFHGYTRGVALGADTLIDRKWTIGGGLAFNGTDVHARNGAHTSIDTKTLFLYGQYKPNNWFVNATATYSMSEYTENKTVAGVGLGASYDVDAYGAQFMTGYDFATGITTQAGMRYLHIAQDSYIDDRDAQIMATDTDFLTGVAGLKYAFAIENDWAIQIRPELSASVTYDFVSDDSATTVVTPGVEAYAVNGNRLSRIGGEFGIGFTAQYKGVEMSLMYDLDLHKDYTSQTGMLKLRAQF